VSGQSELSETRQRRRTRFRGAAHSRVLAARTAAAVVAARRRSADASERGRDASAADGRPMTTLRSRDVGTTAWRSARCSAARQTLHAQLIACCANGGRAGMSGETGPSA
jgi:hypothetical protein